MNTFMKIALGFILGAVSTLLVLFVISRTQNTEENQLREEIRLQSLRNLKESMDELGQKNDNKNIESFELTTKKGVVKLHTYMSKDSVKILMGSPQSTDIYNNDYDGNVRETWKYRGTNHYIDEFTIEFTNGQLKSVSQYKDH